MTPEDVELLQRSELFDSDWYRRRHPEVARLNLSPAAHYLRIGALLNNDPGPEFSTSGYLCDAPDVAAAGVNPLVHYLRIGRTEGRPIHRAGEQNEQMAPAVDQAEHPRVRLVHPGRLHRRRDRRLVLVVGHLAGTELFGAERSLLDVLDQLAAVNLDVLVAVPSDENRFYVDELRARAIAVHVLPVPARRPRRAVDDEIVDMYVDLIVDAGVDAVHVNTTIPREPLIAARRHGVPAVVDAREIPVGDPDMERWLDASAAEIVQSVLHDADYVIATSRAVADVFALSGRTAVVPNVFDEALLELPQRVSHSVCVALVGSVQAKKGVNDFVEVARLLDTYPDAEFRVIGPISPLVHQVSSRGLPKNLQFSGRAADPLEAMSAADIVVNMSTVDEGFGRTTLEAMAAGRPVVVYGRGALPELVSDGLTGFVVPSGDVTLFALRVGQLIDDADLRLRMGRAGRSLASDKYSKDSVAARLAVAYRAILPPPATKRQRNADVRIPIPSDNRTHFDKPFFIANRARFATATSVAFVGTTRIVCASLLGRRLHLIEFDAESKSGEIVDSTATIDGGGDVSTDLIDHDGSGHLVTANCENSSLSWYRVTDRSIEFVESVGSDSGGDGFCHGATFVPGRPDLVVLNTITGPCDTAIISRTNHQRTSLFHDEGWVPKSVGFDRRSRMVICSMDVPVGREADREHVSKLTLFSFEQDPLTPRVLHEHVLPGHTVDGCCVRGDLVLVACQSEDAVLAFDVSGDNVVRLPDLVGFSFPHDVDVSPDLRWVAVANYGTSDVQLRRLPRSMASLAASESR